MSARAAGGASAAERPPLVLTLGEPAGIGPEIAAKAWETLRGEGPVFALIGDAALIERASAAGAGTARIGAPRQARAVFAQALPVIDRPLPCAVVSGRPVPGAAAAVIGWIETAVGLVLAGEAAALVTGPIAKHALYQAGFAFAGHTEFLGALAPPPAGAAARGPVMMLVAADLRASLVTIHEPLERVPSLLTKAAIVNAALVTAAALKDDFGIAVPRLALAALNPHAGEGGNLGREEVDTIAPAAAALRAAGVDIAGPLPADTLFHEGARARFDAVVCLYHDQGLIPAKMLDFWGGVNLTLGLPIVRASPDHGVGFDIAGKGLARPDSLIAALRLADQIARRRAAAQTPIPRSAGTSPRGGRENTLSSPSGGGGPPLLPSWGRGTAEGGGGGRLHREGVGEAPAGGEETLRRATPRADKRLGQHFLLDPGLNAKIARLAGPLAGLTVLEVGPGPGGLTRALLEAGAQVIAVERDARFLPGLETLAAAFPGALAIETADAMDADETALLARLAPGGNFGIVANLPYNIASPLLAKWLTGPLRPVSMTLMFQKEVAARLVAAAGGADYGRLTVLAQSLFAVRKVMAIGAAAFTPPPKVDSALVRLDPLPARPPPPVLEALQTLTRAAFGQRRKMLRASLRPLGGEALARAAGLDPRVRAQDVEVGGFLALARVLLERS